MSAAPRFKPTFSQEKIVDASASSTQLSGEGDVERVHSVLVVDDAPMIVKMTTMLLKRKGHTVESAVNGADALEKLLRGYEGARGGAPTDEQRSIIATPYDVVLMDLQMPVLDGVEAVRRLRVAEAKLAGLDATQVDNASRSAPRQMVIALSANSDEETRLAALEAGADAFMAKPFTYENFAKLLHEKEGK
jgi:CheY-like chemotaxis protein